jgi:hypothetical protein
MLPGQFFNCPLSIHQTLKSFDVLGSLFVTLSAIFLIPVLSIRGNVIPWTHPAIAACFSLFVVFSIALVLIERTAEKPVVTLHMQFHNSHCNLVLSSFLASMSMSMNAVSFNVPLFFQAVLLDISAKPGTRLIPPFIAGMVVAFSSGSPLNSNITSNSTKSRAGNLISWTGQLLPLIIIGYASILAGLSPMPCMMGALPASTYFIITSLVLIGQGFVFPTLIIAQQAISAEEDLAVVNSTLVLFRNLGMVMGVAVSSLVSEYASILSAEAGHRRRQGKCY